MTPSKQPSTTKRAARSTAEWVTLAISSALLAILVGLIVVQIPGARTPPAPKVTQAGPVREANGSFFVPVEVENTGETTATNVQVTATLTLSDGKELVGDQTIDFLAGGEVEELEFAFAEDPESGELELAISGYGLA